MAINSPIIAAGPSKPRLHVLDQPITTHSVKPGESYTTTDADGFPLVVNVTAPEREGQVYFHTQSDAQSNRSAVMYVGVDISGTLTWVPVTIGKFINSYTGKSFDPMFAP